MNDMIYSTLHVSRPQNMATSSMKPFVLKAGESTTIHEVLKTLFCCVPLGYRVRDQRQDSTHRVPTSTSVMTAVYCKCTQGSSICPSTQQFTHLCWRICSTFHLHRDRTTLAMDATHGCSWKEAWKVNRSRSAWKEPELALVHIHCGINNYV